jgi:curved DNA-binding protein CbpA
MTYYEELGVTPKATQEEIRRAFRNASRLLHPDLQQDPGLRQLAEMQMRRLNEVVDTLCDEGRRAEYDAVSAAVAGAYLAQKPLPQLPGRSILWKPGSLPLAAILAGLLLGCLLMFCFSTLFTAPREISSPAATVAPAAPNKTAEPGKSTLARRASGYGGYAQPGPNVAKTSVEPSSEDQVRPDLSLLKFNELEAQARNGSDSRPSGFSELPTVAAKEHAEEKTLGVPTPTASHATASHATTSQTTVSKPAASKAAGLAGVWLYVPDPTDRPERGEYQAEYIELRIQESGSLILGSFRSRYRIHDRPINPSVNFRFQGPADATQFQWEGPGGATGTLKLKLKSQLSLDAEWQAQAVGSQLGLSAGVATLIRRTD